MTVIDTAPGFDTLAWAGTLKAAGVEERQAEAHAEAARITRAGLATKADLCELKAELEAKIERSANRNLPAIMALDTVLFVAMKFL